MKLKQVVPALALILCVVSACQDEQPTNNDSPGVMAASGGHNGHGGAAGEGGIGEEDPEADRRLSTALDFNCDKPQGSIPPLTLTQVAAGFLTPLQMSPLPGDDTRLWVISQKGSIHVVKNGAALDTPVLNIEQLVGRATLEEGLLGLAIHPDYEKNGRFYVHYSARKGHPAAAPGSTIIEEYRISDADPDTANHESGRVVFIGPREQRDGADHNGGGLFFGKDKMLHATLGDGGGVTISDEAQNFTSYLGTIVRFDPLAPLGLGAPSENFFADDALSEIWAYGLRNPFRGTADGCTGDVYIGDVGLDSYEEVNILRPDDVGLNFGWPIKEGEHCMKSPCDGNFTDPAHEYPTAASGSSITGGSVYRGSKIPALRGRYVFADATSGRVWSGLPDVAARKLRDIVEHTSELQKLVITSIDTDNHGELYFVSRLDEALYRLETVESAE